MSGFQWKLRLVHEGHAGVILERPGRRIRFDPVTPPEPDDIVVLTGADPFARSGPLASTRWCAVTAEEMSTRDRRRSVRGRHLQSGCPRRQHPATELSRSSASEAARRWLARRRPDVATI